MKLITAFIHRERVNPVITELNRIGIDEASVSSDSLPPQHVALSAYRGVMSHHDRCTRSRIDVALDEVQVEPAIEAILAGAGTGIDSDGRIFVTDVQQCIHIRSSSSRSIDAA